MAEARQASVSKQTLLVYSKALEEFPLECVKAAVGDLALQERREGETAFPELGKIIGAVRRLIAERRSRQAIERMNAEAKHREEHPEEYVRWDMGEAMKEIRERKAKERGEA